MFRRIRFLILCSAVAAAVSGCLVVPTPHYNSGGARANLDKQTPATIQPGATTIQDVLLHLGEPDAVSWDEHKLAYRSEKVIAIWLAGGGYQAAGGALTKDRYLVLEIDDRGVVQTRRSVSQLGAEQPEMIMTPKDWLQQSASVLDPASTISGRAEWYPGADGFEDMEQAAKLAISGYLGLTSTKIEFRDRTQSTTSPPRCVLQYASLKECRLAKFGLGRRIVVRAADNQLHTFQFVKPSGFSQDKQKTVAALELIKAQMAEQAK